MQHPVVPPLPIDFWDSMKVYTVQKKFKSVNKALAELISQLQKDYDYRYIDINYLTQLRAGLLSVLEAADQQDLDTLSGRVDLLMERTNYNSCDGSHFRKFLASFIAIIVFSTLAVVSLAVFPLAIGIILCGAFLISGSVATYQLLGTFKPCNLPTMKKVDALADKLFKFFSSSNYENLRSRNNTADFHKNHQLAAKNTRELVAKIAVYTTQEGEITLSHFNEKLHEYCKNMKMVPTHSFIHKLLNTTVILDQRNSATQPLKAYIDDKVINEIYQQFLPASAGNDHQQPAAENVVAMPRVA